MDHSGPAWEAGRLQTLQRDNYQCQDCGRYSEVHVHHIKRPEEFDAYDDGHHPSNLVTLCKWCHPKWEGVNARPVLLGDDGVHLHRVVESLTRETVERLTWDYAAESMHKFLLRKNHWTCDKCYSPDGEYAVTGREHMQRVIDAYVQTAMRGDEFEFCLRHGPEGRVLNSHFSARWICEDCRTQFEQDVWDAMSKGEMLDAGWWASAALEAQGVPHDPSKFYDTIMELKGRSQFTGREKLIMTVAVSRALRSDNTDEPWPKWFCEVLQTSPENRPPPLMIFPGNQT